MGSSSMSTSGCMNSAFASATCQQDHPIFRRRCTDSSDDHRAYAHPPAAGQLAGLARQQLRSESEAGEGFGGAEPRALDAAVVRLVDLLQHLRTTTLVTNSTKAATLDKGYKDIE